MINRIFFVTDNTRLVISKEEHDDAMLCLRVPIGHKEEITSLYKTLSKSATPFSICIELEAGMHDLDAETFTSFLFLPAYLRINSQLQLALIGDNRESLDNAVESMHAFLLSQDITNVHFNRIVRGVDAFTTPFARLWSLTNLENEYHHVLHTKQFYNHSLFIEVKDQQELNEAVKILQQEEDEFREEYPLLFELAKSNQQQAAEINSLKYRQAALEAELTYQQEHNEILRTAHPTRQLQDYYDEQYEVLPTWYKRFGHLLKVMTGKRQLNSLLKDHKNKT